jgi:acyl-CoA reductase-like NAD-dependent aldehyde dehydrogenase/nicotinamidase-related amidase
MSLALLLVDLQWDFLARPMVPEATETVAACTRVLEACRAAGVPICHAHTVVSRDGSNAMPHWQRADSLQCVVGTPGAQPPEALRPRTGEGQSSKAFYSAFEDPNTLEFLRAHGIRELIVAGIYLETCVRATLLDAYRLGFAVTCVDSALASAEPIHGAFVRQWLEARMVRFIDEAELTSRLTNVAPPPADLVTSPVPGCVYSGGEWRTPDAALPLWLNRDPCARERVLSTLSCARQPHVATAVAAARALQPTWARTMPSERKAMLLGWRAELASSSSELVQRIVMETGKPVTLAEAEVQRAIAHLDATVELGSTENEQVAAGVDVQRVPRGTVAAITPWNNPVALAVAKLVPALLFGNTVVWKPSPYVPWTSALLVETLQRSPLPRDAVTTLLGDHVSAQLLANESDIAAVTATGSPAMGASLQATCGKRFCPLQAELGGNNAAIVGAGVDLDQITAWLVRSAFSFAGQRCTATRRFIVSRAVRDEFLRALALAMATLQIGAPEQRSTTMGPLLHVGAVQRTDRALRRAVQGGAHVVAEAAPPAQWVGVGAFRGATAVQVDDARMEIVQNETFGPLAVVQFADNFDHALALGNRVSQGLLATLFSSSPEEKGRFSERIEAGMLRINPVGEEIHPAAPFGGVKASAIGPAEHGIVDREFFTRPRTVYGQKP